MTTKRFLIYTTILVASLTVAVPTRADVLGPSGILWGSVQTTAVIPATDDLDPVSVLTPTNSGTYTRYVNAITTASSVWGGGTITINGVTFYGYTSIPYNNTYPGTNYVFGGSPATEGIVTVSAGWAGVGSYGNPGSTDYDKLVCPTDAGNGAGVIAISNLVIGAKYQIQLWGPTWNRTWGTTYDGITLYTHGAADPDRNSGIYGRADYMVGTFTATNSTVTIALGGQGTAPTAISLFGGYVPSLVNTPANGATATSTVMHATFGGRFATNDVWAYWNTVYGGTNAATWTNSVFVGSVSNVDTNLSATATGLTAGITYYFTFRATNGTEDLWATNVLTFSVGAAPDVPGYVSPTNGATRVANDGTLVWTNAYMADAYDVYIWKTNESRPESPDVTVSGTNWSVLPALEFDTNYNWQIVASNIFGTATGAVWSFAVEPSYFFTENFSTSAPPLPGPYLQNAPGSAPSYPPSYTGGKVFFPGWGPGVTWDRSWLRTVCDRYSTFDWVADIDITQSGTNGGVTSYIGLGKGDFTGVAPGGVPYARISFGPCSSDGDWRYGIEIISSGGTSKTAYFNKTSTLGNGDPGPYRYAVSGNNDHVRFEYTAASHSFRILYDRSSDGKKYWNGLEGYDVDVTVTDTVFTAGSSRIFFGCDVNVSFDNLIVTRPPPTIVNAMAVNVTTNSADLRGTLVNTNGDVYVYWDTVPRGQTFAWAFTNSPPDAFTNLAAGSTITNPIGSLSPGSHYYFIFLATNPAAGLGRWSSGGEFWTIGSPAVDNSVGATGIGVGTATLNGRILSTNGAATYGKILWGTWDGTNSESAWEHTNDMGSVSDGAAISNTIGGLLPGVTYYYRTAATNTYGWGWATNTIVFWVKGRYTWTNTADGAVGNWIDSINWDPSSGYPGKAIAGDTAALTNSVSGSYTSVLDTVVANSLAGLSISNNSGQAWLIVTNAALSVTGANSLSLGRGAMLEIDNGGVVSNSVLFNNFSGGATIYLNSGGRLHSAGVELNSGGCTGTVMGATSQGGTWNLGGASINVGEYRTDYNNLTVNNATITNCAMLYCGGKWDGAGRYNRLTITNRADVRLTGSGGVGIKIGQEAGGGDNNSVTVAGSTVRSFGGNWEIRVGMDTAYGAVGNSLTIGADGIVTNFGLCIIGSGYNTGSYGDNNGLTVRDGGKLYLTGNLYCGKNGGGGGRVGANNSAQVIGTNSLVKLTGGVTISQAGDRGFGNSLIVTNGGRLFSGGNSSIGNGNVSNRAVIAGIGSVWDLGGKNLSIGSSISNTLTISDGGVVANARAVSVAANCKVTMEGGAMWASSGLSIASGGVVDFTADSKATLYLLKGTEGGAINTVQDAKDAIAAALITLGGATAAPDRFWVREMSIDSSTYVVTSLERPATILIIR